MAAATLLLAQAPALFAQGTFTISRIADNTTPSFSFSNYSNTPQIEGGFVAFIASSTTTGRSGIYANIGSGGAIAKIVDTTTTIPGGTGAFSAEGFSSLSLDVYERPFGSGAQVDVAFDGKDSGGHHGIYLAGGGGTVSRIIDRSTSASDLGSHLYGSPGLYSPSRNAGDTAFEAAGGGGAHGVFYQSGTTFTKVADSSTAIPNGTGTFTEFYSQSVIGGAGESSVVFKGNGAGGQEGIYKSEEGVLSMIVDGNTAIPGGTTNFGKIFLGASMSGHTLELAFKAHDTTPSQRDGIYKVVDGVLSRVADQTTVAPGGVSTFSSFGGAPAIDNGHVAFTGMVGSNVTGLYTDLSGTLTRVIKNGDSLDGRTVQQVLLGAEGLDGLSLAFRAFFTNGTQGIYVAKLNDSLRDDVGGANGLVAEVNGGTSATGGVVIDFGSSLQTPGTISAQYYAKPNSADFFSEFAATNGFGDVVANFLVSSEGGPQQFWDVNFSGQFSGPATLTFHYDEARLSSYFRTHESELGVYHYGLYGPGTERSWRFHGAGDSSFQIDTANNLITLALTNFSPIVLGAAPANAGGSVPEPSSLIVMSLLGVAIGATRRRRR